MIAETEKLCDELNTTYNPKVMDKYNSKVQSVFFKVAKNSENSGNKNLIMLINNYANAKKEPNVKYITGPGNISKYVSDKWGKTIYLFGENDHSNKQGCATWMDYLDPDKHMSITTYFKKLFTDTDVFIDLFIEFPVVTNKQHSIMNENMTLSLLHKEFKRCLHKDKCQFPIRVHGVDIRNIISDKYKKSEFSKLDEDLMMIDYNKNNLNDIWITPEKFRIKHKKIIQILKKIRTKEDLILFIKKEIETHPLIQKELSKTQFPKELISDIIIAGFDTDKSKLNKPILIEFFFESLEWDKYKNKYPPGLSIVSRLLTSVNALTVDVYSVSRMFRLFDVKQFEHYPKSIDNIIYYAGNGHTMILDFIFMKIGFKKIEQSKNWYQSCVNMEGIKQPLFK